MASFLDQFAVNGRFGVANGSLAAALAAGYSEKQIATAITKGHASNLHLGHAVRPGTGDVHTKMSKSTAGTANNWIHHFQDPSGQVGVPGLSQALAAGYTPEQLIAAGAGTTSQGTPSWGVPGFGQVASQYLQQQAQQQPMYEPPEFEMPEFNMPGSTAGGGRVLGTSALGVRSNIGSQDNTGGTGDALKRKKKKSTDITKQLQVNPLG